MKSYLEPYTVRSVRDEFNSHDRQTQRRPPPRRSQSQKRVRHQNHPSAQRQAGFEQTEQEQVQDRSSPFQQYSETIAIEIRPQEVQPLSTFMIFLFRHKGQHHFLSGFVDARDFQLLDLLRKPHLFGTSLPEPAFLEALPMSWLFLLSNILQGKVRFRLFYLAFTPNLQLIRRLILNPIVRKGKVFFFEGTQFFLGTADLKRRQLAFDGSLVGTRFVDYMNGIIFLFRRCPFDCFGDFLNSRCLLDALDRGKNIVIGR
jgi:hypothetical protein